MYFLVTCSSVASFVFIGTGAGAYVNFRGVANWVVIRVRRCASSTGAVSCMLTEAGSVAVYTCRGMTRLVLTGSEVGAS